MIANCSSALPSAALQPAETATLPLRFMRPTLPRPERWLPYLEDAYQAQWFTNFGPVHTRFTRALNQRFGAADRMALPVANCTVGLTAVFLGLGLKGRVAMPSFTFSAPAHALLTAGCTPVFCDIDPDTWELCPTALDELLRREPVTTVLHVRTFGLCRDLSAIQAVCDRHGVPLIVDAAAALGGRSDAGPAIGHAGDFEVFSLHATKTFGIGEGGVIFASPERVERLKHTINFGIEGKQIASVGVNGKLCEMHAAIGLAVMDELDASIAVRSRAAAIYQDVLSAQCLPIRPASQCGRPAWSAYPVELASKDLLPRLCQALSPYVEVKPYYSPVLHRTKAFHSSARLPVTEALEGRMLCLPIYSDMSREEALLVTSHLSAVLRVDEPPRIESRS